MWMEDVPVVAQVSVKDEKGGKKYEKKNTM
jgi:hypothetical protein